MSLGKIIAGTIAIATLAVGAYQIGNKIGEARGYHAGVTRGRILASEEIQKQVQDEINRVNVIEYISPKTEECKKIINSVKEGNAFILQATYKAKFAN